MRKNEKKWDFEKFWGILRKKNFLIRKPNQRRSRHPQVCFHFQIKKTCLFQYLFFSDRSFSGCVFPDYFLFRRCLFRLYPFQALSCYTISFSTCAFADYILLRKKLKVALFFFSASLTWIYETTDIKRKKTYETSWHKNLWDTCRNCISTSVLNCSFLTPFHTISGHLIGHLIFQHKTQKHLKKYLLYWSILYKI